MKTKVLALSLVLVLMASTLIGCSSGSNEAPASEAPEQSVVSEETSSVEPGDAIVVKLAYMSPELENDPYHQFAVRFKEAIEEKTDGKYVFETYGGGVLGKDRELSEGLQYGTVDMAVITSSPMGNFVPAFQALDLPFLFSGWDHVHKFLESDLAEELYAESEEAGIISLGLIGRGARSVTNAGDPIQSVEDLKGMKIRVIESSIFVDTFSALGASPQAMSWGEVFTALQQGTIDGHENSMATINNERVYEVQDNVTKTEHIFAFTTAHASSNFWDSLPTEDQELFKEVAEEITIQITKEQEQEEQNFIKLLEEQGMNFYDINRDELKDLVNPVYEKFAGQNSDYFYKAIEALNN
ncbi:TRAP transporter substrate-binding protein [Gudongella sp. DL1XJH-153]|uniref:TRAP transporter substrate-binding protein n=1 Tax=Gudongella sp. DL1XJH-153 TaxID=3409804 RepID=UPI003BB51603